MLLCLQHSVLFIRNKVQQRSMLVSLSVLRDSFFVKNYKTVSEANVTSASSTIDNFACCFQSLRLLASFLLVMVRFVDFVNCEYMLLADSSLPCDFLMAGVTDGAVLIHRQLSIASAHHQNQWHHVASVYLQFCRETLFCIMCFLNCLTK